VGEESGVVFTFCFLEVLLLLLLLLEMLELGQESLPVCGKGRWDKRLGRQTRSRHRYVSRQLQGHYNSPSRRLAVDAQSQSEASQPSLDTTKRSGQIAETLLE
jgi:hypothetical protein